MLTNTQYKNQVLLFLYFIVPFTNFFSAYFFSAQDVVLQIIVAGFPATKELSGILPDTTLPAPTMQLLVLRQIWWYFFYCE